jgi:VWFA-related protein
MNLSPPRKIASIVLYVLFIYVPFLYVPLITLGSYPAAAQSSKKPEAQTDKENKNQAVLRVETELVQIDVVVADKKGSLIRDLRREDFELFEDGKRQQVTHFAAGTSVKPATWLRPERRTMPSDANAAPTPAEIRAGRYIVVAIDDFHLEPENLLIAKRVLHRFINEQMVAGDQVAFITTSGNIGLYQQFTADRAILERAVDRLSVQTRNVTNSFDVPRISDFQAELIDRGDRQALELAALEILRLEAPSVPAQRGGGGRGASMGGSSAQERAEEQARSKARMIVAQNAHYTRSTLDTLDSVIRSLRQLTGRKMLVLLSDGFFLGGNSSSQISEIQRIIDAATRSGVVIYSIDARGLIATPPGGDASTPSGFATELPGARASIEQRAIEAKRDGMNALAQDTGGFLVVNNNDLNLGFQRVLDDNEVYYVLAYEPPESRRDGRFHRIEVRIADRPELKVRTRKGYLSSTKKSEKSEKVEEKAEKPSQKQKEKADQQARAVKAAQIRSGLVSLFPLRDIPLEMSVDFIDIAGRGPVAMINAHIDASALELLQANGLHNGALDLTGAIFDERGKVAESFSERLTINLKPSSLDAVVKQGFSYLKYVSLKPGFYQTRVALREEGTARLGSAACWIEIPDLTKKQLALSSIFISAAEDERSPQNGTDGKTYQPRPTAAKRRFKRGGKADFLVFVYNAKADKKGSPDVVIQSQVYSGSKLVYASPLAKVTPASDGDLQRLPYAARVSLDGFEAGDYELRLLAIDRLTKATTNKRMNFIVD